MDGLDPMLSWGMGSSTGHTAIAIRDESGRLFVHESTVRRPNVTLYLIRVLSRSTRLIGLQMVSRRLLSSSGSHRQRQQGTPLCLPLLNSSLMAAINSHGPR